MAEVKLVVSDVDGTLVAEGSKAFSGEFNKLVSLIKAEQIPFMIASGRSPEQMEPIRECFDMDLPMIAYNGALIIKGEEEIFNASMNALKLQEMIQKGDQIGLSVLMGIGCQEYSYRKDAYTQHHEEDYGWVHPEYDFETNGWENTKINKVLFFDYEGSKSQGEGKADVVYEMMLKMKDDMNILRYDEYCVEAMPKGISKATAIQKIAECRKIDMQQIMVFGDSDNDLEMIQKCGIGIAVGNATENLKNVADYICNEKDSAGVLEALTQFWPKGTESKQKERQV